MDHRPLPCLLPRHAPSDSLTGAVSCSFHSCCLSTDECWWLQHSYCKVQQERIYDRNLHCSYLCCVALLIRQGIPACSLFSCASGAGGTMKLPQPSYRWRKGATRCTNWCGGERGGSSIEQIAAGEWSAERVRCVCVQSEAHMWVRGGNSAGGICGSGGLCKRKGFCKGEWVGEESSTRVAAGR